MRNGSTRKAQGDEPATQVKNYITPSGLEFLKDERRFLLARERPTVTEVVARAASNGDRGDYVRSMGGFPFSRSESKPRKWWTRKLREPGKRRRGIFRTRQNRVAGCYYR